MDKKINLEEIRSDVFTDLNSPLKEKDFDILYEYKDVIILAMKEACRQTLELAAENADLNEDFGGGDIYNEDEIKVLDNCGYVNKIITVNKQSILDIIKVVD